MEKKHYIAPELEDLSFVSGNNLMASSVQNYNLTDYDWSQDGYLNGN